MENPNIQRVRMRRGALLARLPDAAEAGLSWYLPPGDAASVPPVPDELRDAIGNSETGAVLFRGDRETMLVVPPFSVERAETYDRIEAAPLVELLKARRAIAVFLLRLGGFSVGFFRGDALVASKTGQRFVKNRNRKGGQSQRRFERTREKHMGELFEKACEAARATLAPYEREIEYVLLGGTRQTLIAFQKECGYFDSFGGRLMQRLLPTAGDPRKASLEAAPRDIWSSDVYVVAEAG